MGSSFADSKDDGNLEQQEKLLQDFNVFESTFLPPYVTGTDGAGDVYGSAMNWTIDLGTNYDQNMGWFDETSNANGNGVAETGSNCRIASGENILTEQEIFPEVDEAFERNLWLEYWNVAFFEDFDADPSAAQTTAAGNDTQHANGMEDAHIIDPTVLGTGRCCGGKCHYAMEDLIKLTEKPPKGRRRKGYTPTPQQLAAAKHLQKLRNRESAARATARKKAHITNLQTLVLKLRAENRLRKKLLTFLEMEKSLELPSVKGSLRRTTSGPI